MKPFKILTRTILLVSIISLFNDIASEMLYPVLPVYLRSIGFSVMLIGILEGIAEAAAGLSKGYFGQLSDVRQKRAPFVRWGYTFSAISKPMMAIWTFPLWIFFTRTLDRFSKGIRTGARDAMLSHETTPEHKGMVFGFHRGVDTVGAAIGPVLALIFLYFYPHHYKMLFFIAFFPGIIAVSISLFLNDKKNGSSAQESTIPPVPLKKIGFLSYLKYWNKASPGFRYLVTGLLVFTLFNSSDIFLLLALKNRQMTDTQMIGFYIFYNLVYALLSFPAGIIADRIGLRTILVFGLIMFAVVYFFMGFATTFLAFGVLFVLYSVYTASTEGISKALITNLAEKSETATAIGFYDSCVSICTMIASSIAGVFWFTLGPQWMFVISGVGAFCVAMYLAIVFRKLKVSLTTKAH